MRMENLDGFISSADEYSRNSQDREVVRKYEVNTPRIIIMCRT